MKRMISMVALAVALFASASAFAYDGYVTASVRLRAGPDSSYPAVARLRAGTTVVIEGCVDDWSWCDVSSRNDRGWVNGSYLQYRYQGRRVLIPRYGVQIGIPIISFVFGSYWDDHYRSRSWYRERDRWSRFTPRYSHGGARSSTYSQPRVESRPSGAAPSQPTYQTRPRTTTVAPAPQPAPTTPVRTQERTVTPSRPAVEHKAAEPKSAPPQERAVREQQSVRQQQAAPQAQNKPSTEHRAMTPAKETAQRQMPAQAKSPPAQAAGKDKGKDKGKDQGQGKDKDGGKDKEKDKDQGGG